MNQNSPRRLKLIAIAVLAATVVLAVILGICAPSGAEPAVMPLAAAPDEAGSAIVAWEAGSDLMVQKIDRSGKKLWGSQGILLSRTAFRKDDAVDRLPPFAPIALASDGGGGAIIAWVDSREVVRTQYAGNYGRLMAQRIDDSGRPLWGDGVGLGYSSPYQIWCRVIAEQPDEVFIVWGELWSSDRTWAQKVSRDGTKLWGDYGMDVFQYGSFHFDTCSDGQGGIVVVGQAGAGDDRPIWAQRFNAEGKRLWSGNGVQIFGLSGYYPRIAGVDGDVFIIVAGNGLVQKIGLNGKPFWESPIQVLGIVGFQVQGSSAAADSSGAVAAIRHGSDEKGRGYYTGAGKSYLHLGGLTPDSAHWEGKTIAETGEGGRFDASVVSHDAVGFLVTWREWYKRASLGGKIAVQRVDSRGSLLWAAEGVSVFPDTGLSFQRCPIAFGCGSGEVLVITNTGHNPPRGDEIRAQRLDASGKLLWGKKGLLLGRL